MNIKKYRTILLAFFVPFIPFALLWFIFFGNHGDCYGPLTGGFDVILKNNSRTEVFSGGHSLDFTEYNTSPSVVMEGSRKPVSFPYFWGEADSYGSIYKVSKDIYIEKNVQQPLYFEVIPWAGCVDGSYKWSARDVSIRFDGTKYESEQPIPILYSGGSTFGIYRLNMSLSKQFHNEWNINIHWLDSKEFEQKKKEIEEKKQVYDERYKS